MAATYAHIILVDSLLREKLDSIPNLSPSVRTALAKYTDFCKLGAVSPDCPSVVGSTGATGYGNIMHYLRTADFVRYAIPKIYAMNFGQANARACIAWIFGYTAHLCTDFTIHPVVSRKFGPYAESKKTKKQHRLCELHQDVYLYHKLFGGHIVGSDFLKFSGLAGCSVNGNTNKLHPAIVDLWTYCLEQHPREETKKYVRLPKESLRPNNWYATFLNLFQHVVTAGLPILQADGYAYPKLSALNPLYIQDLPTASGSTITYDTLFEAAKQNLLNTWASLAAALDKNQPALLTLPNGNLDTGLADATQQPIFVV